MTFLVSGGIGYLDDLWYNYIIDKRNTKGRATMNNQSTLSSAMDRYTYVIPSIHTDAFSLYSFAGKVRYNGKSVTVSVVVSHKHDDLLDDHGYVVRVDVTTREGSDVVNTTGKQFTGNIVSGGAGGIAGFADRQVRTILRSWSNMVLAHELAERLGLEV